jgi:hypothetical protein
MSKTQNKRQERLREAASFISERRAIQLQVLEQNYEIGVKLFLDQKDTLSPEEVNQIEKMMAEQRAALDKLHEQVDPRTKA